MFCQRRGPLGEYVLMFLLLSCFEVLAVSSTHSAAGSQIESCLNTASHSVTYIPLCPSWVDHARSSRCEGVRAQKGCRAVGGPWLTGWGKTARSQSSVTPYSHCYRSTLSAHSLENTQQIEKTFYIVEFVGAHVNECFPRARRLACN